MHHKIKTVKNQYCVGEGMKKLLTVLLFGMLISVSGMYLLQNNDNTDYQEKNVEEVVKSSPFREFIYVDCKVFDIFKNEDFLDNINIGNTEKNDIICMYLGNHGSLAIEKKKSLIEQYIKKDKNLLMENVNEFDLGNAKTNDLVKLLPSNYKDVLVYSNKSIIGVYYDLGMHVTNVVKIVRKDGDEKIDTEKIKNNLMKKANIIDCNVEDLGDKVYTYLEYRGYIPPKDLLK